MPPTDFYRDEISDDIWIDGAGRPRLTASNQEEVAQRLGVSLRRFLGEWFLEPTLGVPYFEQILVKNPDISAIRAAYLSVLNADPGVVSVTSLDLSFVGRTLSVGVEVLTSLAEQVQVSLNWDLITLSSDALLDAEGQSVVLP